MAVRDFRQMLEAEWAKGKFLCIGLDPDISKIPEAVGARGTRETILAFNRAIVDATKDIVGSYKPNPAFYEAYGDEGWQVLRETIQYIHEQAPELPVILDGKRGDIGNTNAAYAASAFDHLLADGITVQPYLGGESLEPFFSRKEKGVIVLCHTSNPGSMDLQELKVDGEYLYKVVARLATTKWNANGNCCLMVGATYPDALGEVRSLVGDMPILVAGIGAQHGDLEKTIQKGISAKKGLMINVSRSIIYASKGEDFAAVARAKAAELDSAIRAAL